jgi:hypothetical protein
MRWSVVALVERYGLLYNTRLDQADVTSSLVLKLYLTRHRPLSPIPPNTPRVTEALLIFSDMPGKSRFESYGDHAILQAIYPPNYLDTFWMILRQEQAVSISYAVEDHDALHNLSLDTAYFPDETARQELMAKRTASYLGES